MKDYNEQTFKYVTWKQKGTGMCGVISWELNLNSVNYSVSTLGCFGNDFPQPENANGVLKIDDTWYWCYK